MTFQDQISSAITLTKTISYGWADANVLKLQHGDKLCNGDKLIIINNWILMLEDYMDYNFDSNGVQVAPYSCLTADEVTLVISKINAIVC